MNTAFNRKDSDRICRLLTLILLFTIAAGTATGMFLSSTNTAQAGPTRAKPFTSVVPAASSTDFSITTDPSFAVVEIGGSSQGLSTITVSSLGGFTGSVVLTTSVTTIGVPPFPSSTANFAKSSLSLNANGSNSTSLSFISYSARTFLVNVTGTSGTLVHSTLVVFQMVTFYFSISQSNPRPVPPGGSITASLEINGQNDFSGVVNFTVTNDPSYGLTWTLDPPTVTGSGSSTLTLFAGPDASGTYNVNVVAKSGSISSGETSITVTIGNHQFPSIDALPFGLPITIIGFSLWSALAVYLSRLVWLHRNRTRLSASSVDERAPE